MIRSIEFTNYKVLRQTTLKLSPFTLLIGANGSGKSTVLQALQTCAGHRARAPGDVSAGAGPAAQVSIVIRWEVDHGDVSRRHYWVPASNSSNTDWSPNSSNEERADLQRRLEAVTGYSLQPDAMTQPVQLLPQMRLAANGSNLAGVVDRIRDQHPERFEALTREFCSLVPEFDRILFETPQSGHRSFELRTQDGGHRFKAGDLSSGTLLALALLTVAHLPDPPALVFLEEPDRGIHPRLLRAVKDALYRLAYPQSVGETRPPVQVIATTHSPYMLDFFRDHPEEVVVAEKHGLEARFVALADRPDLSTILGESSLGDAWYAGVLGGVPAK